MEEDIQTDHQALKWLKNVKDPFFRLTVTFWRLKLEEYEYDIEYKKKKENQAANALFRIYSLTDDTPNGTPTPQSSNIDEITYDDHPSLEFERLIEELECIEKAPPDHVGEYRLLKETLLPQKLVSKRKTTIKPISH